MIGAVMDYFAVKTVHQSLVALTALGFTARGIASLRSQGWVRSPMAKRLPHLVDTLLLLSGLTLAWLLRLSPAQAPWLTAKLIGLLVYIALGLVTLRPRFPTPVRVTSFVLALLTLGWMVSVAVTKSPAGVFGVWAG